MPAYSIHVLECRHGIKEIVESETNYNVLVGKGGFAGIQSMNELDEGREFLLSSKTERSEDEGRGKKMRRAAG